MAPARDFRVFATKAGVASAFALSLAAGNAAAEGLSIGIGGGAASPPTADGAAPASPPPAAAPASPSPEADAPQAESSTPDTIDKSPANYEFALVSAAAYQSWAIASDVLYFGMGGGLGPPLYRYSKFSVRGAGWDPSLEVAYANAFLRIVPSPYVDVDLGPKIAIGSVLYDSKEVPVNQQLAPTSFFSFGAYADLRVGTRKIKVGPRFEFDRVAYANFYETGWRLTPLMLRVVH